MKRFLLILLSAVTILSISACGKQVESEKIDVDETTYVEYSGEITNIIMYNQYMEITIKTKGEEKTFHFSNTKRIIDKSPSPKENPYLKEGVHVTIKCTEEESKTDMPRVSYIIVNSYDGIFLL